MHTSGGRVSVVIGGITYKARGVIKLSTSNMTVNTAANQDGTAYRTVEPKVRTAEITFDRFVATEGGQPLQWSDDVMLLQNLAVSFIEQDGGQMHLLTGACFTGTPGVDLATGEVDGLTISADSYKTIRI